MSSNKSTRDVACQAYARWAMVSRITQTGMDITYNPPPGAELEVKIPTVWIPVTTGTPARGRAVQAKAALKDARTQTPKGGVPHNLSKEKGIQHEPSANLRGARAPSPLTSPGQEDEEAASSRVQPSEMLPPPAPADEATLSPTLSLSPDTSDYMSFSVNVSAEEWELCEEEIPAQTHEIEMDHTFHPRRSKQVSEGPPMEDYAVPIPSIDPTDPLGLLKMAQEIEDYLLQED